MKTNTKPKSKTPPRRSPGPMRGDIARVAVTRRRIARRVKEMADLIAHASDGEEITILAVLTGSLIFLADLIRHLPLRTRLDVVSICSYPGKSIRSRGAKLLSQVPKNLKGRNVLILDDILDSGQTLATLLRAVQAVRPAAIRTCVLLRKRRPDMPNRPDADFVGFDVDDEFLVGYGLDHDNIYRNLPDICVLKQHARRNRSPVRKALLRNSRTGGAP